MKRLYLGNTSEQTDKMVSEFAALSNTINHGLITKASDIVEDGFYHSTVIDISLAEIAKVSCDVVLLDQPKESFSTNQEYYNTVELFQTTKTYWQKLVEDNKSFCIFPFINHSLYHDKTTLCCRSKTVVANTEDFDWNVSLNDIRNKILNGEKIKHCNSCYKKEESGYPSARQTQTIDWARRLDIETTDDLNYTRPLMYDIFPNNNCNLMCRMCSPEYSVLIQREQNDTGSRTPTNWKYVDLEHAQVVYIAGGEPTAMIDFQKFLDRCEQEQKLDLEIRINTNASKISDSLLRKMSKFKKIIFTVSIDGYEKQNEYQRWLSSWDNVIKNIQTMISNKHTVNFNITVSIYTIKTFPKLIEYLNTHYPTFAVNCSYAAFENDILNPFIFEYDEQWLNRLRQVEQLNICYNNPQLQDFVKMMYQDAKSSKLNTVKLKKFFEYNDNLDIIRNSNLKDYIPELEEKRQLIGVDNG